MKVQNNPIATCTNFPAVALIYDVEYGIDEYIIAKIGHASQGTGYDVNKQTPRKYKLYMSKDDRYYFKWNGLKFYLDESIKTNI